jgi:glycosyltransferase involved in cell wall biosynthesis
MNQQPTVLLAAPYFPPQGGGLERYVQQISVNLAQHFNWRVIVVTSQQGDTDTVREKDGVKIYGLAYRLRWSNTPFDFRWYAKIRRIIAAEQPDLINVHSPVPGLPNLVVAAAGKRPVIVTYHSNSLKKGGALVDVPIWLYEHTLLPLMLNRANTIICSSDFVRLGFLAAHQTKSTTITTAVNPDLFKPTGHTAQYPHVLCLGGLHAAEPYKGLSTILQACQQLQEQWPELHLTVIGEGDSRQHFEDEAQRLGLRHVTFTGRIPPKQHAKVFGQGGIFAMPTSKDSLPTVLMEAMSSGLPVVTTDVGSITDLVTDGENGLIIPPHDPAVLAKALDTLLGDPERMANISKVNRSKILAHHSWRLAAAATNEVFHSTLVDFAQQTNQQEVAL